MTPVTSTRILVAVDDSPAALEGLRVAVDLARHSGAQLRCVHVLVDGELLRALGKVHHDGTVVERRAREADLLLRHVVAVAERSGVPAEGVSLEGEPGRVLLDEARDWRADLLVVGRADAVRPGTAYVGGVARQLLEFSDVPVLVVPQRAPGSRAPSRGTSRAPSRR
jgi:nucleotide-binding universal stress UspA family protein